MRWASEIPESEKKKSNELRAVVFRKFDDTLTENTVRKRYNPTAAA